MQGSELDALRGEIDRCDATLIGLLSKRARLVRLVAALKRRTGIPIYDGAREQEIWERIRQQNPGPMSGAVVAAIFGDIIDRMRTEVQEQQSAGDTPPVPDERHIRGRA